ncbi:MAG: DUF5335 family protein [Verrucomicrobiota bacterium]
MKNEEIRSEDWAGFCERFTESNRGSLLNVDLLARDGLTNEIARDFPLEKMTFDKTDACSDIITICLGRAGERRINHSVIEPIRLLLTKSKEGRKILQIEAENGMTSVTFHSGHFPPVSTNGDEKTIRGR